VDFKIKYVETERYRLERRAKKSLFGLYRARGPIIPASGLVDSRASTNVPYWADRLLVLEEAASPYEIDADTLETLRYDPSTAKFRPRRSQPIPNSTLPRRNW